MPAPSSDVSPNTAADALVTLPLSCRIRQDRSPLLAIGFMIAAREMALDVLAEAGLSDSEAAVEIRAAIRELVAERTAAAEDPNISAFRFGSVVASERHNEEV